MGVGVGSSMMAGGSAFTLASLPVHVHAIILSAIAALSLSHAETANGVIRKQWGCDGQKQPLKTKGTRALLI